MNIDLNPDSKPFKHKPYHLNLKFKEKVKKDIYIMLASRLIFPMDEVEWISPIIIQERKVLRIYEYM
jgi:hypothetical protein